MCQTFIWEHYRITRKFRKSEMKQMTLIFTLNGEQTQARQWSRSYHSARYMQLPHNHHPKFFISLIKASYNNEWMRVMKLEGCVKTSVRFKRAQKTNEQQQILSEFCKINPEGTCGPIWPEVVPFSLSCPWLYYCVKKIVNM